MWRFSRILKKISQIQKNDTSEVLNPSQPHVAFLYPLKTSENLQIFCFQGVQKSNTGLFLVTLFRVVFFQPQFTLQWLTQPDLESRFVVWSQLGPSILPGSSPSAGLQMVTKSTHLSMISYPQLVSNSHHSEIRLPKQLDYRCTSIHPAITSACHYTRQ